MEKINWLFYVFLAPRKVAAGNVVIYAATSQILHVHVNVSSPV